MACEAGEIKNHQGMGHPEKERNGSQSHIQEERRERRNMHNQAQDDKP
jgi:hypothetical protein